MGTRLLVAFGLLAGCGARLEDPSPISGNAPDAGLLASDAPTLPPVDAQPCLEGDARATDPTTGACLIFFTGPATAADARTACVAIGAQLATVRSAPTNATILGLIGASDAFLGATDTATEATYVWRDDPGDPVTGYTNWRAGEPNNGGVGSTIEEDCLIIEGARGGTWDDRPCAPPPLGAGAYAYVCER